MIEVTITSMANIRLIDLLDKTALLRVFFFFKMMRFGLDIKGLYGIRLFC